MLINRLRLKNWRNFTQVDVSLCGRQFIVGPNASGKSNLLDVFRFLYDIAKTRGGGLQAAIENRIGLSRIRCLSARRDPEVVIDVSIARSGQDKHSLWRYSLGIKQETRGFRLPYVSHEKVWKGEELILERPDDEDKEDTDRRRQTYLEQVNNNREFRDINNFFCRISYLHLVPQLLRHANVIQGRVPEGDPFGQGFLERIANAPPKTQKSRLKEISRIISAAVPRLKDLQFERDSASGQPHISALYDHWRPNAGRQREDQFSDGTLRLMALVWCMLEGDSVLLLEEPELSLHEAVVSRLAAMLYRSQKRRNRQVLVSTHSRELLSDPGIGGEEILLLTPTNEGTNVSLASSRNNLKALLEMGEAPGEVVIPSTRPQDISQLQLLF